MERAWQDPTLAEFVRRKRPLVIAAGKAAWPMTAAVVALAGEEAVAGGLVAGPRVARALPRTFDTYRASHPLPDEESLAAGLGALSLAGALGPGDGLLVLLSGGASAMLAVPVAGLPLGAKTEATRRLLLAGMDIQRLNTVRKHLSAIKGGWLAASTRAEVLTLAISDVIAPPEHAMTIIGSGPTVADPTTFAEALAIVDDLGPEVGVPPEAREVLERGVAGKVPETPKPGDPRLARSHGRIIGAYSDALAGARGEALARSYHVAVLPQPLVGEAREAGPRLVRAAVGAAERLGRPACVLAAGETTVRVRGPGRGGRNQELVLAATPCLADLHEPVVLASVGTDGVDGPTDAAGALSDSSTLARARAAGLDPPEVVLARNDSYSFFDRLGALVRTGPTGTNVGDLQVLLFG